MAVRKTFPGIRVLVFDLDGTLIDSKLDLVHAVNATMREMHRPERQAELIASYVGNGAPVLIQRALGPGSSEQEVAEALEFFLRYYREHMLDHTVAYPGVREGLEELKDRNLAVLSNKPVRISRLILEGLGLASYFRHVYGGNSFERKKPDPLGLETLLKELGARPPEAMMVGDSAVDVQTARNAGTWACGVRYGFAPEGFGASPPDVLLDNLSELPAILGGGS